ncbi:uncharacterized protein K02A2.6-like [Solenopsis invicta]|uniref:uncharacterized protein K02A2.6-like n=1 Tax=Solenopsis invicta TaxID=13686 RepID=UPI00193E8B66|nr:uncharacterized protein K02A2.6-like [Solenopsis invicta]
MFARHGIPLIVISDGGPQFSSQAFKKFATEWEFTHEMSSPTHAQSNGMAERNVQTAKKIFKKVLEDHKDIYLALLYYRNMTVAENFSPAQILMSRKLRTTIPGSNRDLEPKIINKERYHKMLDNNQLNQQRFNSKGAKNLVELQNGTKVANNETGQKRSLFKQAEKEKKTELKKCYVEIEKEDSDEEVVEGETIKISSDSEAEYDTASGGESMSNDTDVNSDDREVRDRNVVTTRSGRVVKRPDRLGL